MTNNKHEIFIKKIMNILKYIFLSITSLISIFPFYWMIVGATNTSNDVISGKMTFGNELLTNMSNAINNTNLMNAATNSFKIAFFSVVFSVIVSSMAAYGFQMYKSKGKKVIYNLFLLSMMIPFSVLLIPQYRMIVNIGLLNNLWAVILPSIISMFLIFFFYQSLSDFPIDTIESARLDGASELLIFFRIVIPQLKSSFATAIIYSFMTSWNNFMWPLVVLQTDESQTLPVLLSSISDITNYSIDYGVIMVVIITSTIPLFIIFTTMQKYFVAGMTGSAKG